MNFLSRAASLLLFAGTSLFAGDLSGIWTGQIPARNNEVQDITFRFVQNGDTLTGKMYRDNISVPVLEGKISGDQISFRIFSEEQVGNLFVLIKYTFTGSIKGNGVELTREREANPMLTTGNPSNRQPQKPTFMMTKVF